MLYPSIFFFFLAATTLYRHGSKQLNMKEQPQNKKGKNKFDCNKRTEGILPEKLIVAPTQAFLKANQLQQRKE